jgi:hypothetical protein
MRRHSAELKNRKFLHEPRSGAAVPFASAACPTINVDFLHCQRNGLNLIPHLDILGKTVLSNSFIKHHVWQCTRFESGTAFDLIYLLVITGFIPAGAQMAYNS